MSSLLAEILTNPKRALDLNFTQYGQLIRQGRSSDLLASLSLILKDAGILGNIPEIVLRHLQSSELVHAKQKRDLDYDLGLLKQAILNAETKLVLLKGAAYLQSGFPASVGRLISDIDIIVPRSKTEVVEKMLHKHGWASTDLDPYDQRYYRKWMHEIPPLLNKKRGTTLDLHHTILPPTAAPNVNANLLFEELVEVKPGVFTLSPRDMVIHSATHLFHEGEFHHGLRDLWDLDRMLRDFAEKDEAFWQRLVTRAGELDLMDSLFHGLRYCSKILGTPVPAAVMAQTGSLGRKLRSPVMDFLFARAFRPNQPECRLAFTNAALSALYIRSHYLRMPLYLLIPHLARKAWMVRFARKEDEAAIDAPAKAENAAAGK